MAEIATIARPYAEAVFRQAKEKGKLEIWSGVLQLLSVAVRHEQMAACIANPSLSGKQKADLLAELLGTSPDVEVLNFISLLAENGRLAVLPAISDAFEHLKACDEGVRDAVIQSAYPLDDQQSNALLPVLEKHFGGRLRPQVEIVPELIGGVRVIVGDQMLDASVRGRLEAMKTALTL